MLLAHGGGYQGPAPLTPWRALTSWELEPLVVVPLVLAAVVYLWGVHRLHRRGDRWPVSRTIMFVGLGLGTIALATTTFLATYDTTLFWVHMVQHMILSMISPIFLALGAPITLALRTLPPRPRRWLTRVLHARVVPLIFNPATGFVLLFATPFVLYYTSLYDASLSNPWLHDLLHLHFVVAGSIYFWPLIGLDPVPGRLPYVLRMLVLFLSVPAHAWLGVSIMGADTLIAFDHYSALERTWGPSLAADQETGGAILWVMGDVVGIIVLTALFFQWVRADSREAARTDRRLDRGERTADPEDELAAYNARLAALARRGEGTARPGEGPA